MTNYVKAWIAFLRQVLVGSAPIEVYHSGQVPDDATFPYLEAPVVQGEIATGSYVTLFLWCQIGSSRNTAEIQRATLLDEIRTLIPAKGAKLRYAGGMAVVYRNTADFLTYYNDPDDKTVIGARISLLINHYEE